MLALGNGFLIHGDLLLGSGVFRLRLVQFQLRAVAHSGLVLGDFQGLFTRAQCVLQQLLLRLQGRELHIQTHHRRAHTHLCGGLLCLSRCGLPFFGLPRMAVFTKHIDFITGLKHRLRRSRLGGHTKRVHAAAIAARPAHRQTGKQHAAIHRFLCHSGLYAGGGNVDIAVVTQSLSDVLIQLRIAQLRPPCAGFGQSHAQTRMVCRCGL